MAEVELETWLERSRADPAEEPAFFRRLLDATVYVHAPASDDSGKLRLIQFRHPDGFDAIPFFTSLAKAQFAGSSVVRILEVQGGELLTGTRGAMLQVRPAQQVPAWLGPTISACLQGAHFVSAAYVLETAQVSAQDQSPGLLICLVADMAFAERAARRVMTAIQPLCSDLDRIIDLTVYDVGQPLPEHLDQPGVEPVFKWTEPA